VRLRWRSVEEDLYGQAARSGCRVGIILEILFNVILVRNSAMPLTQATLHDSRLEGPHISLSPGSSQRTPDRAEA